MVARKSTTHQPGLFDTQLPSVAPCPRRVTELRGVLEGLMREIAQTLVTVRSAEAGHEQDYG